MGVIRTAAAADLLGVSASTLRAWERRYGFPTPQRTEGGHRQYDLAEIEALVATMNNQGGPTQATGSHTIETSDGPVTATHQAVAIAKHKAQQNTGQQAAVAFTSAGKKGATKIATHVQQELWQTLLAFDLRQAAQIMEREICFRPLERAVDELLLPVVAQIQSEEDTFAAASSWRFASGWLAAAMRSAPQPINNACVVVIDGCQHGQLDSLALSSLELNLRRRGIEVLAATYGVSEGDLASALKRLAPAALVFCGSGFTLDSIGRLVFAAQRSAGGELAVFDFHGPLVKSGSTGVEKLQRSPLKASERIVAQMANTENFSVSRV